MSKRYVSFIKDIRTHPISTIPIINEKLKIQKKSNDIQGVFDAYYLLFWAYSNQEKHEISKLYLDSLEWHFNANNMEDRSIQLLSSKSRYYYDIDEPDSNLVVLEQFYNKAMELNDSFNIGRSLGWIGAAYQSKSDYDQAMYNYNRASTLFSKFKSIRGLQSISSKVSIYYARRGDFKKAIREGDQNLQFAIQLNDTLTQIRSLSNLAGHYILDNNLLKAKEILQLRNRLIDRTEYPPSKKFSINMALAYIKNEQYGAAMNELDEIEEHYLNSGNLINQALVNHYRAVAYRGLDKYDLAAESSKKAYNISKKIGDVHLSELSAYTLFQTYHWRGKHKEAVDWLLSSQELNEQMFEESKMKEILNLETKYETLRKQQEIELLKANAETDRVKRNALWLVMSLVISLGLALFYAQYQRSKKRKQTHLNQLKIAELERIQLMQQLDFKQKELTSKLLFIAQKNELLQKLSTQLEVIDVSMPSAAQIQITKLGRQVRSSLSSFDTWDEFIQSFKNIHKTFINTLVDKYGLGLNEIRLASLIKMNFSSKEIAQLLNISNEGIKKARYRLRKKLNLSGADSLEELILSTN